MDPASKKLMDEHQHKAKNKDCTEKVCVLLHWQDPDWEIRVDLESIRESGLNVLNESIPASYCW
ncbi:hypothetical protein P7K49_030447 [Saguinus oedipus]|uniref:Uncharacterized protein n=1 Tax=Saguinus oedipus TaxID=9490 RepID=A0ABQ9U3C6_SAGOE|nr:hypothetical protein P7K49_030447 [Saguinus oedipus]